MTHDIPLDPEQVRSVLNTLDDKRRLRGIRRPDSGLTGSVYVLQTDQEDLILRAVPGDAARWKPEKDRTVYALLRRQGLPAPTVLKVDLSRSLLPFAYVLSERLPGVTLSQAYDGLDAGQRRGLYRQLGDALGRMHSLSFAACGDVSASEDGVTVGPAHELMDGVDTGEAGPFADWREMHRWIVRRHLRFLRPTEFGDLVEPLDLWFREHESCLDTPITPRLLHMDLHGGNILVQDGHLTGILDVEEALIGHNEFDLMRTELAHFRGDAEDIQEAFVGAYARHITPDAGYEQRKPFYELSRNLVGLRCLVTYTRGYSADAVREARAAVRALLTSA